MKFMNQIVKRNREVKFSDSTVLEFDSVLIYLNLSTRLFSCLRRMLVPVARVQLVGDATQLRAG